MTPLRTNITIMAFITAAVLLTVIGMEMSKASPLLALLPLVLVAVPAAIWLAVHSIRGAPGAMMVVLILGLFLMASNFRPIQEGVPVTGQGFDAQSVAKAAIYAIIFGISLFHLHRSVYRIATWPVALFMLYWAWTMMSVAYSNDPLYSFASSFGLLSYFLFGLVVTELIDERRMHLAILTALGLLILASWFAFLLVPELGARGMIGPNEAVVNRFVGIAGSFNGASQIAVLFLLTVLSFYISGHRFQGDYRAAMTAVLGVMTLLAIGMLILSQSRGAAIALVGACGIVLCRRAGLTWVAALVGLFFLGFILVIPDPIAFFSKILLAFSRFGRVEEVLTMTGRTTIWEYSLKLALERPLFGYGFGVGGDVLTYYFLNVFGLRAAGGSAHNVLIQSMLDIGFVGTVFLALMLGYSLIRVFLRPFYLRDLITCFILIVGLVESAVSKTASLLTFIWILFLVYEPERQPGVVRTAPKAA